MRRAAPHEPPANYRGVREVAGAAMDARLAGQGRAAGVRTDASSEEFHRVAHPVAGLAGVSHCSFEKG
jgi:hypothetical protein